MDALANVEEGGGSLVDSMVVFKLFQNCDASIISKKREACSMAFASSWRSEASELYRRTTDLMTTSEAIKGKDISGLSKMQIMTLKKRTSVFPDEGLSLRINNNASDIVLIVSSGTSEESSSMIHWKTRRERERSFLNSNKIIDDVTSIVFSSKMDHIFLRGACAIRMSSSIRNTSTLLSAKEVRSALRSRSWSLLKGEELSVHFEKDVRTGVVCQHCEHEIQRVGTVSVANHGA